MTIVLQKETGEYWDLPLFAYKNSAKLLFLGTYRAESAEVPQHFQFLFSHELTQRGIIAERSKLCLKCKIFSGTLCSEFFQASVSSRHDTHRYFCLSFKSATLFFNIRSLTYYCGVDLLLQALVWSSHQPLHRRVPTA